MKKPKKIIERYSKGEFTEEELKINKDSGITKEAMQEWNRQLLIQK